MALAATSKCGFGPSCPVEREQRAFDGANNGDESQKDIAGGEQRGQRIGGAAGTARGRARIEEPFLEREPSPSARPRLPGAGQDAGAARDALARPHFDFPFGAQENIHAGAELDEADAFALGDRVAGFLVAHDAARDQAGDLREDDAGGSPATFPMVTVLRSFCELATSRLATRNWPLVYSMLAILPAMGARFTCTSKMFRKMLMRVHSAPVAVADDADHFAVGGRNRHGAVRDGAIGIAEEIEAEEGGEEQGRGESRVEQVADAGPL